MKRAKTAAMALGLLGGLMLLASTGAFPTRCPDAAVRPSAISPTCVAADCAGICPAAESPSVDGVPTLAPPEPTLAPVPEALATSSPAPSRPESQVIFIPVEVEQVASAEPTGLEPADGD